MIEQEGVDAALRSLRAVGVFLSFEEFKGTSGTIWAQGDNLRVRRAEPEWTTRGKLPMFRPLRRPLGGVERS